MKFLLLLLLSPLSLFAVTITVINDSEYNLEARIYDPKDELITTFSIPPNGHYYSWSDSFQEASDWTEGPFVVRFYCPTGEEYGKITHVANKTTVRTKGAIGHRRCNR
ncbi:hypothetical protein [Simkania sp.]|uniref:hypothetical protein n=1 Tax=Simkania sp. TaxID=34094 RepID=UPI003B51BECD